MEPRPSPIGAFKDESTADLLNRLWTKAAGTTGYDKEEWMELERRMDGRRT